MCGIAGVLDSTGRLGAGERLALAARMADTLRHRGPDDEGAWADPAAGIALGHRRLAVLELSPAGRQPLPSSCGRYLLVLNGEIYNFRELRRLLEEGGSLAWRGNSDTEVLAEAVGRWGVETALERSGGMFALAVWDRRERELWLVRDRLGEKPLYYGRVGPLFVFGSELKALAVVPGWRGEVDRGALTLYLRHNYLPAPFTIYRGIRKLAPGTWLRVRGEREERREYWSWKDAVEGARARPFRGTEEEAVRELETRLTASVKARTVSDVPLGVLLSGGIDSTAVAAAMRTAATGTVRTFTVGFREGAFDEAPFARGVASYLGTEHHELYVTPAEAREIIPRLPELYDEPFADSSQIPTALVARFARCHVTVALTGDGGDELFGGYDRYRLAANLWRRLRWLPAPVRRRLAGALAAVPSRWWDRRGPWLGRWLSRYGQAGSPGDRMLKLSSLLALESPASLYRGLVSHWKDPATIVVGGYEPATLLGDPAAWPAGLDFTEWMMALDARTYLPDDLLVKLDRATMAVGLESRAPFLDHLLAAWAWSLPLDFKVRQGTGKWLLRRVLSRQVPAALWDRPKMGFGVPIGEWLRGALREWAETLLAEHRLRQEGYFDPVPVRRLWEEHLSGRGNWQYYLWDILMFQGWVEKQGGGGIGIPRG